MKFHHLARHGQFFGPTAAAAHLHQPQPRDLSPIKSHLQQQQLAASRAAEQQLAHHHHLLQQQQQQQQQNNSLSDDEDDDEDNPMSFYDSFLAEQQRANGSNTNLNGASESLDASGAGFLMDKNKKLFPQKLWELIHNPSIQHCLHWSQDGQRVYLNRNEFETYYLKTPNNQFHTQKAISFVRQMNMYGFRKVDDCYYENDNFRRDQQHLLKNMIRRHPNKGLFVGLDHHQLAAAAAAQQALQVNQQLQQLEHQHKHRAEQALRLNSYLNSHHHHHQHHHPQPQQHPFQHQPTNLTQHHSQISQLHSSLKQHSSPFEQMSTRLAQAAVNQLTQQQQRQIAQQLSGAGENNSSAAAAAAEHSGAFHQPAATAFDQAHNLDTKIENLSKYPQQQHRQNAQSSSPNNTSNSSSQQQQQQQPNHNNQPHHQHKKSRLLSNFYASTNSSAAVANDLSNKQDSSLANQLVLSQDSMHSTSSVDTQPSQCSSTVNSVGSASGSPQPNSPMLQKAAAIEQQQQQLSAKARAAPSLNQEDFNRYLAHSNHLQQQQQQHLLLGQDLTSQSLAAAARQAALHQTLVRSLLQLKQQNHHSHHHQDLLASIQQQHQLHQQHHDSRSLLESLASLSSVGTNSIIDPTSNSPTERTATPPSGPASPTSNEHHSQHLYRDNHEAAARGQESYDENIALDLASKTNGNNYEVAKRNEAEATIKKERTELDDSAAGEVHEPNEDAKQSALKEHEVCVVMNGAESPLDGTRKVKKFLEDHQNHHQQRPEEEEDDDHHEDQRDVDRRTSDKIKRELDELIDVVVDERSPTSGAFSDDDEQLDMPARKRLRTESLARSLVTEICDRRGNQLEDSALDEAARYTGKFIEVLLEDASMFANKTIGKLAAAESKEASEGDVDSSRSEMIISSSSLSLALKSMPTKLVGAIQPETVAKEAGGNDEASNDEES